MMVNRELMIVFLILIKLNSYSQTKHIARNDSVIPPEIKITWAIQLENCNRYPVDIGFYCERMGEHRIVKEDKLTVSPPLNKLPTQQLLKYISWNKFNKVYEYKLNEDENIYSLPNRKSDDLGLVAARELLRRNDSVGIASALTNLVMPRIRHLKYDCFEKAVNSTEYRGLRILGQISVAPLKEAFFNSEENEWKRKWSLRLLGETGDFDDVFPILLHQIKSKEYGYIAEDGLGLLIERQPLERLSQLSKSKNSFISNSATIIMIKKASEKEIPLLFDILMREGRGGIIDEGSLDSPTFYIIEAFERFDKKEVAKYLTDSVINIYKSDCRDIDTINWENMGEHPKLKVLRTISNFLSRHDSILKYTVPQFVNFMKNNRVKLNPNCLEIYNDYFDPEDILKIDVFGSKSKLSDSVNNSELKDTLNMRNVTRNHTGKKNSNITILIIVATVAIFALLVIRKLYKR